MRLISQPRDSYPSLMNPIRRKSHCVLKNIVPFIAAAMPTITYNLRYTKQGLADHTLPLGDWLGLCERGGGEWGVYASWMPLPSRPRRYCNPALLVRSYVCSLKLAQIEINYSTRLGDMNFRTYHLLMEKAKNNVNFGGLSLLNKLSKWAQFELILKSCVCSLK